MTNSGSHRGWKAIAKRLGYSDLDSVKRQVKRLKIPVVKHGRFVILDEAVYRVWYLKFNEVNQEIIGSNNPSNIPHSSPLKPPLNGL